MHPVLLPLRRKGAVPRHLCHVGAKRRGRRHGVEHDPTLYVRCGRAPSVGSMGVPPPLRLQPVIQCVEAVVEEAPEDREQEGAIGGW